MKLIIVVLQIPSIKLILSTKPHQQIQFSLLLYFSYYLSILLYKYIKKNGWQQPPETSTFQFVSLHYIYMYHIQNKSMVIFSWQHNHFRPSLEPPAAAQRWGRWRPWCFCPLRGSGRLETCFSPAGRWTGSSYNESKPRLGL